MREELIISGRNNHLIDPHLEIWEWQIPSYLFLGGLVAGLLFFAAIFVINKKEDEYPTAVKIAPLLTPILLGIGLFFLFLDLKHKLYFWRLYTTIRLESPMSWGAWVLMAIMPLSVIWSAIHLKELYPKWDWHFKLVKEAIDWLTSKKLWWAWAMVVLSLILGIYTGILFSAFNARPLWNTSILGPLFLASGLSAGAATIVLLSKHHYERLAMSKIDLLLIAIELFLIIHYLMGLRAGTQVSIEASNLFLGGEYTALFWIFVVMLGLVIPAGLEIMEIRKMHIPYVIAPILVLLGSLMLRFIMAYAGQLSRWLY
jgi:protein NrfD